MWIIAADKYSIISGNVAEVTHDTDASDVPIPWNIFFFGSWTAKEIQLKAII